MPPLIDEYLRREFGGDFETESTIVTVGTGITDVRDGDGERPILGFINVSANTIRLHPLRGVTSTRGIILNASGGSVSVTLRDDFQLPFMPWQAIASGAGSDLFVFWCRRHSVFKP